jgi:hypothetical protein
MWVSVTIILLVPAGRSNPPRARSFEMATEPTIAILNTRAVDACVDSAARRREAFADYWALTKPEVNFLILVTTFAGFYLASTLEPGGSRT